MYEQKHHLSDSTASESCITRKGFWFHVDGALGAAYAPFLQMAYESGLTELKPPLIFDFRLGFVSSIVTSGHKWIGAPWPCGIYISKTEFQLRPSEKANISYIESPDHTLSGSRKTAIQHLSSGSTSVPTLMRSKLRKQSQHLKLQFIPKRN